MPLLDAEALHALLAAGERGGIFFFFGEEEYLKEEALAAVVAAHIDPATRDFNLDQVRGPAVDPETLASMIQTPPMMAAWRVVVIRDAQALASATRSRASIEQVLGQPLDGLVLVLVAQIPDGSQARFYARLKKQATAVNFPALGAGDLPGWLIARAADSGVDLDAAAARAMAAAVGTDLGVLVQELAKLVEFVGERRRVRKADVAQLVQHIPTQNRWDWFDMVGQRRFQEAREALPVLLRSGESGVGLVIGMGTHLLRIALAAADGDAALAEALPPRQRWLAKRIGAQARRWTPVEAQTALDDLLRADRLMKSTSLDEVQILEDTLLRLQVRAAAPR